jgi:hypothetical protein
MPAKLDGVTRAIKFIPRAEGDIPVSPLHLDWTSLVHIMRALLKLNSEIEL